MVEIQTNNNLIAQKINSNLKVNDNLKQEISSPEISKTQTKVDTLEISQKPKIITPKDSGKSMKILNGVLSSVLFVGIFFLPDLIFAKWGRRTQGLLDKYKKFKPFIGNEVDAQKQNILKNGNIKITLEKIQNNFKYNEIIIGNKKGNIIQRILIKKEQMSNGKYITRLVKSYKGDDLVNSDNIYKNETKYLFKKYKRAKLSNREYQVFVKRRNEQPSISKLFTTNNGEPVLRIKENNNIKENTAFLYKNNKCIGVDSQIIPKDNPEKQYNILTIPNYNIKGYKYDPLKEDKLYDKSLLNTFKDNF